MRKTLSDKGVAALKPRASRYTFPDPELRGHYVRVQPGGAKFVRGRRPESGCEADLDHARAGRRADHRRGPGQST